ncbi:MAG: long-chain fatty acid--CoA ligase [Alphaproteobacteria bacterium]|nr:long-chain fatty acid--CoA ligase [Alphaproteobacteria bacterium]
MTAWRPIASGPSPGPPAGAGLPSPKGRRDILDYAWSKSYPPKIRWDAEIPARPLYTLLSDSVARFPNNPCLDFLGRRYTYAEVGALVEKAARGFQELGVRKGTRVGLFLPNSPHSIISYFGALRAGATVVNYSPLYAEPQIRHQVEDSGTEVMVTLDLEVLYPKVSGLVGTSPLRQLVVGTLPEVLPFPKSVLYTLFKRRERYRGARNDNDISFARLLQDAGRPVAVDIDPAKDIAVLQYTGGTTGAPKGAMLTHANLFANAHQAMLWLEGCRPGEEKMLGALPFFHVFAMTVAMNLALYIGGEIILHPRFVLDDVLRDIDKKRPTLVPGVPTMFAAINHSPKIKQFDLRSVKFCISGGAPLPVEVKQNFEAHTGCKLVEGYGLTEASPVATCNPLYGVNKTGSIGQPLPGTTIVITDRDDPRRVVGPGERGEICIQGPQVMAGYWNRPHETAAAIVDGRLRTGDIGTMDEDGYVFLIDRIKDLILVGGFNVYPRNVEEAIYEHAAVAECTVISVPDAHRGQAVKAFVRCKDGAHVTQAELIDFLRARIGKHELPREVEFRHQLPKTMVGKLSKKELVEEEAAKFQAGKAMAT